LVAKPTRYAWLEMISGRWLTFPVGQVNNS